MRFTKSWSCVLNGMEPFTVEVEVSTTDTSGSDTVVSIVGLPDSAVRESKDRVYSALCASGFRFPKGNTIISLAPAGIKKSGPALDLPIAIALIAACEEDFPLETLDHALFFGELALDGRIRPVNGALAMALHAREHKFQSLFVPMANGAEASIAEGVAVYAISDLRQAYEILKGNLFTQPVNCDILSLFNQPLHEKQIDFKDIKGHQSARRGLEIAAAGNHNLILVGTPGCGKTLLARAFSGILPKLHLEEALKVTQVHSIAGALPENQALITQRPFRSPHHTISEAGLLGGSSNPRPGEVSMAHHGVLFLDELPEYKRSTLEVLRQPMESGQVTISRASGTCTFPANFMLIAAMNPCPCGFYGSVQRECRCSSMQVQKYRSRISGPLLDRIDIHLETRPLSEAELSSPANAENSASIQKRVEAARLIQQKRFNSPRTNDSLQPGELQIHCKLDSTGQSLLSQAVNSLDLSARAYDRILRVAIADLEGETHILPEHIGEAVQYRALDRKLW